MGRKKREVIKKSISCPHLRKLVVSLPVRGPVFRPHREPSAVNLDFVLCFLERLQYNARL